MTASGMVYGGNETVVITVSPSSANSSAELASTQNSDGRCHRRQGAAR
ncbi:MAG: hypothetical protein MZV63_16620 [Marinilabiliales bacterium]|nr:hypothetical protein [Marinilabiliales bacterium]